jgi:hypothetical protein
VLTARKKSVVDIIHKYAPKAITLSGLDRLAQVAREENVWGECEVVIHERNLRLLGKDGKQAIYIKDGVTFTIWDGWTVKPKGRRVIRVHARALCENGFRYVRQGKTWREA